MKNVNCLTFFCKFEYKRLTEEKDKSSDIEQQPPYSDRK